MAVQGPILQSNSNLMENLCDCNSIAGIKIATNFANPMTV